MTKPCHSPRWGRAKKSCRFCHLNTTRWGLARHRCPSPERAKMLKRKALALGATGERRTQGGQSPRRSPRRRGTGSSKPSAGDDEEAAGGPNSLPPGLELSDNESREERLEAGPAPARGAEERTAAGCRQGSADCSRAGGVDSRRVARGARLPGGAR